MVLLLTKQFCYTWESYDEDIVLLNEKNHQFLFKHIKQIKMSYLRIYCKTLLSNVYLYT